MEGVQDLSLEYEPEARGVATTGIMTIARIEHGR
jgi:hypothetical protein